MDLRDFRFKKKFGQNFLKDEHILDKIKDVIEFSEHSFIIEIGPGAGSLTKKLASTGNSVLAYEVDLDLKCILEEEFRDMENVSFIFDDFLKRNLREDIAKYSFDKLYVVANLPYYITTPIIEKVIRELDVDCMVLMVQKEVAERFTAKVGTKDYNSLTVFLKSYFDTKIEFVVSRNCFVPKPNVDSAVVSFQRKKVPYDIVSRSDFERLVRDSFQFKRKTLRNNLKGYDLEKIEKVLNKYEHDLSMRAESIGIEEFVEISNALSKEN